MRILFLICVLLATIMQAGAQSAKAHLPQSKNKIVVIAHRGNHVRFPENTLAACRAAIECGADYIEVDLRSTKDKRLVVMHDAKIDRTTNGSGTLKNLTLEEVRSLQVFNGNKKTHRVPEFREILALCKDRIHIYLDFKDADVIETYRQIKQAGMLSQVVVYVNHEDQYKQWRATAPELPIITSAPEHVTTAALLKDFLSKTPVEVLDNVTIPEMIREARSLGVSIWLDAQSPSEGPAKWNALLDKNVDGLQSDKPADLVKYLKTTRPQ